MVSCFSAQFFLEQAGYEVYLPKIRQRRHRKGRRIEVLSPLFPGYLFARIELQWRGVRKKRMRWPSVVAVMGQHAASVNWPAS
jgi:hypothetical protein